MDRRPRWEWLPGVVFFVVVLGLTLFGAVWAFLHQ